MDAAKRWSPEVFKNTINDVYRPNISLSSDALKKLKDFQENDLIIYVFLCAQILNDSDDKQETVFTFTALAIKNFFEIRENRGKSEIKNQWSYLYNDEAKPDTEKHAAISGPDFRKAIMDAMIGNVNSEFEKVRGLCAKTLASICLIDGNRIEEILCSMFAIVSADSCLQNVDGMIKFFNELFMNGYYEMNSLIIPEYLPNVVENTISLLHQSLEEESADNIAFQKTAFAFISNCGKNMPSLIDNQEYLGCIFEASEAIFNSRITDSSLYNEVCNTFFAIVKSFYPLDSIGDLWGAMIEKFMPVIVEKNERELPDEVIISVLYLIYEVADYEHKLLKSSGECKSLIQGLAPSLIEPLLNYLIIPLEEGEEFDDNIDEASPNNPFLYACCALNEVTRISQNEVAETIFSFIGTFLPDESAPDNYINAALYAIAALTFGPFNEGYADNLYSFISEKILYKFAFSENDKIKENAMYVIYRIIRKYQLRCDDDFMQLIEIIDANYRSRLEIRKRCGDIFKQMCAASSTEFVDTNLEHMIDTARNLSSNGGNPNENILVPMIGVYLAIGKASDEENIPRFLELLQSFVEFITGKSTPGDGIPDKFYRNCYVILIAAICKKLGSNVGEHSDEVMSAILDGLGDYDDSLYKDSITAMSFLIGQNQVSQSFYPRMMALYDTCVSEADNSVQVVAFRLIGKYIAKTNPPLSNTSSLILNKVFELIEQRIGDVDPFLNALQLVAEVCASLTSPDNETLTAIDKILNITVENIDYFSAESGPRISIYVIIIYGKLFERTGKERKGFFTEIYMKVLDFVSSIYDKFEWGPEVEDKSERNLFLIHSSILMMMILKTVGELCNTFINKRKYIKILKEGMNSDDERVNELANKAYEVLRNA